MDMLAREGVSFTLSDEVFQRWWDTAITPEDASEFVHFYGGTMADARFVCALDYLTTDQLSGISSNRIVAAYVVAQGLPDCESSRSHVRLEAQTTYELEAVRMLMNALHIRAGRQARRRVEAMAVSKIEDLYKRAQVDTEDRLKVESLMLDASMRFLSVTQKEMAHEQARRDRAVMRNAVERSQQAQRALTAAPSVPEARLALEMLRDHLGPEDFKEVITPFTPHE